MNEQNAERLSAFLDGDPEATNRPEVLALLLQDDDTRQTWSRYHLIGDALRQMLPDRVDPGLARRISGCLVHEPTVLARRRRLPPIGRPLAGLAIAASVAAMGIFVMDRGQGGAGQTPGQPQVAGFAPVTAPAALDAPVAAVRWAPADQAASSRLNTYLLNYSEQRAATVLPGMVPAYVRLVGHEDR
ncbi:MAG: hypothetical protein IT495_14495 [Gammaproteobacteria bacterium]|nr:hypothetical protein [Gammaproteobacteria bacterium]